MITLIDDAMLDALCAEAAASPRRRKNRNFHPTDVHPGHRLLNAMQQDSYIPPHRHLDPNKDETFVVLRGSLGVITFDDDGKVLQAAKVGVGGTAIGVDIPHGAWHTAVALADDTVFLEAKAGPYLPPAAGEKPSWAPAENSAGAAAYLVEMKALFDA
ncbi:WbuC family cupin fold metalloprotein [Sulfuritalea sp.]|uniref:WbuC family cupin fold metalloprotein n=1 Tax=Sulfuritalea sp. TaxID=2480090 RepID=UPI0025E36505|nr:WbuC family cupin fold metalloprotein [Sulfuritalea sp.]